MTRRSAERSTRVGILALGASNSASIVHGLRRAGAEPCLLDDAQGFDGVDALVVPGVANAGFLLDALERHGLRTALLRAIDGAVPVLGVCAGFQAMFDGTAEAPGRRGLGVFAGSVDRLAGPKVPHIGWNRVEALAPGVDGGWAYFAHSYAAPATARDTVAVTEHGAVFASIARRRNVIGVQFHPERSGEYGAAFLQAFVNESRERARAS